MISIGFILYGVTIQGLKREIPLLSIQTTQTLNPLRTLKETLIRC